MILALPADVQVGAVTVTAGTAGPVGGETENGADGLDEHPLLVAATV